MKFEVPTTVGVPVILPFAANTNPAGRAPAVTDHVIGAVPPVDCSVALYAEFTTPFGSVVVVMLSDAGLMVILKLAVALRCDASFTSTVKLAVPEAVGVPEMMFPVRVRPAGSVPPARLQL